MENNTLRLGTIKSVFQIPKDSTATTLVIWDLHNDFDLLSKRLPKSIETVYIYGSKDADEKVFDLKFLEHLPNLKKIEFKHIYDIDDPVIKTNLSDVKLPVSLECLECYYLILNSFKFLQHLKNLKTLEILGSAIEKIEDDDLPESLEYLRLIDIGFSADFIDIPPYTPTLKNTNILKNCQKLKGLNLNIDNLECINDFYFPLSLKNIHLIGETTSAELDFSKHEYLNNLSLYKLTIKNLILPKTLKTLSLDKCTIKKEIIDSFPKSIEKEDLNYWKII